MQFDYATPKIYILAGTYEEFREYRTRKAIAASQAIYLRDERQVKQLASDTFGDRPEDSDDLSDEKNQEAFDNLCTWVHVCAQAVDHPVHKSAMRYAQLNPRLRFLYDDGCGRIPA